MGSREQPIPKKYDGVMVSSTFTDLKAHRAIIIEAINCQDMKAIAMEYDSAKPGADIISSSLQMVRECAGYVAIVGYKYGQIPKCSRRNRNRRSITELEFREARRLGRPTLLFIMGSEHPVKKSVLDEGLANTPELIAFTTLARQGRIYATFDSPEELARKAIQSVAKLRWHLHLEDQLRRQTRLLSLLELAKTGSFSDVNDLTAFEVAALKHVACIRTQQSGGSQNE